MGIGKGFEDKELVKIEKEICKLMDRHNIIGFTSICKWGNRDVKIEVKSRKRKK